jgi:hypothetical protein
MLVAELLLIGMESGGIRGDSAAVDSVASDSEWHIGVAVSESR